MWSSARGQRCFTNFTSAENSNCSVRSMRKARPVRRWKDHLITKYLPWPQQYENRRGWKLGHGKFEGRPSHDSNTSLSLGLDRRDVKIGDGLSQTSECTYNLKYKCFWQINVWARIWLRATPGILGVLRLSIQAWEGPNSCPPVPEMVLCWMVIEKNYVVMHDGEEFRSDSKSYCWAIEWWRRDGPAW